MLSRRAVLEEERKEQRQQILDRLQPGLIIEGQISNIVDFGAFVDLDGIDGLIHISELSWSHVNHPTEILKIGDTVQVKVLDIDRDRQRISLGLKQTQEDPWQRVSTPTTSATSSRARSPRSSRSARSSRSSRASRASCTSPSSPQHHVENPREVVQPGDEVKVKILEIDSERRRLSLSIKRVEGQVLRAAARRRRPGDLDDMPELGLSEDVFAGTPSRRRADVPEAEVAEAAGRPRSRRAEAEPEPRPRPTPPRPSAEAEAEAERAEVAPSRRPSAGEAEPAAEAVAEEPEAPAEEPAPEAEDSSRPSSTAPPFVGLTGGIGAGKSEALAALERLGAATLSADAVVHELYGDPELRAAVVARWGDEVAPGGRGRPRRRRRATPSPTADERALARGPALAARRRADRRVARERVARASRRRARSWSRCRCCSRPAWRPRYDATIAVVADEHGPGASAPQRAATRRSTSAPRAS